MDKSVLKGQCYCKENTLLNIQKPVNRNKKYLQDKSDLLSSDLIQLFKPNIWFGNNTKLWAKNKFLS